jgi:predicted ATP-grasp superfamily ATP-dependent carboligase
MESDRVKKKVLVISIGWEQAPLIQKLVSFQDMELELYGLHYPGSKVEESIFKQIEYIDYRDILKILEYANTINPDFVISDEDDYGMFLQAILAEKLNIPGPKIENAQIACNKFLQRIKSVEQNINVPRHKLCKDVNEVYAFAREIGFPLIIKPIDSRGSIGVSKIETEYEINEKFLDALVASPSFLTIVEEFIDGDHFNVDGYCFGSNECKALAVSENIKSIESKGTVNDSIIYGSVEPALLKELLTYGTFVANQLGYFFGFFHGEFIRSRKEGKIFLTEMANRGGGILISEVVLPYHTGSDFLDFYMTDCFGLKKHKVINDLKRYCRIDFVTLESGKIFKSIDKDYFFKKYNGIIDIVPFVNAGDLIPIVKDGSKRHIMLISNISENITLNLIKSELQLAGIK